MFKERLNRYRYMTMAFNNPQLVIEARDVSLQQDMAMICTVFGYITAAAGLLKPAICLSGGNETLFMASAAFILANMSAGLLIWNSTKYREVEKEAKYRNKTIPKSVMYSVLDKMHT